MQLAHSACTFPTLPFFLLFYFFALFRRFLLLFCPVYSAAKRVLASRNVKVHFTWEELNSNGLHRLVETSVDRFDE